MALFPTPGSAYYNEKHGGILSRMEAFYTDTIMMNQQYWTEADIDARFEAGDQSVFDEVYGLSPGRKKQFTFNLIQRIVNVTSGYQRRNRKSTIVIPVEQNDQETADQFSKIFSWANRREGVLETISEAFNGALVTGMNMLHIRMDYRNDPMSGDIKVNNCSYNSFVIDPFFKKPDLSDCNGIWKRSYLSKIEIASLLPEHKEEILSINGCGKDGKFEYMPESYNYNMKNLLAYDEFYYRSYRTQKLLYDTNTGESFEWTEKNNDRLKLYLNAFPSVTLIKNEIPTVRLAIVVDGRVMYDGPTQDGLDVYPFVPVFAYYRPELPYFSWRVQGMVRGLRDAQYLYNRRKIIELDIVESQRNSGFIYKEGMLVNNLDIYDPSPGKGIAIKKNANIADIIKIQSAAIDPSLIALSDALSQLPMQISGANEELLGSAVDDKSGILSMLRQGAGLTTLQRLFDQLDLSQKLLGSVMLKLIQANFTPEKVRRITEQEPSEQFYHKAFGKFDCAIEEGVNTTTQRQNQMVELLHVRELGVPIPDDVIIDAMTIQNKSKIIQSMEQAKQEQQQLEQAQADAALREQETRIEMGKARAMADQGLGAERFSRIEENAATAIEKRAEAVKDRELGALHLVKALKEIEDIDLQQVEKLLNLSRILKAEEANIQQEVNQKPTMGGGMVQPPNTPL